MNENSNRRELTEIFLKVFEGVSAEEHSHMLRGVHPWSSLRHIELINTVEDRFGIQMSVEGVLRAESFDSLLAAITELQSASHIR